MHKILTQVFLQPWYISVGSFSSTVAMILADFQTWKRTNKTMFTSDRIFLICSCHLHYHIFAPCQTLTWLSSILDCTGGGRISQLWKFFVYEETICRPNLHLCIIYEKVMILKLEKGSLLKCHTASDITLKNLFKYSGDGAFHCKSLLPAIYMGSVSKAFIPPNAMSSCLYSRFYYCLAFYRTACRFFIFFLTILFPMASPQKSGSWLEPGTLTRVMLPMLAISTQASKLHVTVRAMGLIPYQLQQEILFQELMSWVMAMELPKEDRLTPVQQLTRCAGHL